MVMHNVLMLPEHFPWSSPTLWSVFSKLPVI